MWILDGKSGSMFGWRMKQSRNPEFPNFSAFYVFGHNRRRPPPKYFRAGADGFFEPGGPPSDAGENFSVFFHHQRLY